MFDHLGVVTKSTDMSFGISIGEGRCEYEGSLKGLMAQPTNLLKLSYWSMLFDLVRFYKTAVGTLKMALKVKAWARLLNVSGMAAIY